MSVYKDEYIKPAQAIGAHLIRSQAEGLSQTFKRGAPLVFSSGYLVEATSGAALDIVGFALTAGHNAAAGAYNVDYVPVEFCRSWKGKLAGATAHAIAQTDLGTAYGLASNGDGTWYVDADESTAEQKSVTVTELIDAIGTEDGWVKFSLNLYGDPYAD